MALGKILVGEIRSNDITDEVRIMNGNTSSYVITQDANRPGGDDTHTCGSVGFGYNSLYLHDQTTGVARKIQLVNGALVVT